MEKILNFINIPKHIINHKKRKIIESYVGEKKIIRRSKMIVIFLYFATIIAVNIVFSDEKLLLISLGFTLLLAVIMSLTSKKKGWSFGSDAALLNKIILKDEDGKNLKVWELSNKTSLLLGKKTQNNEVDIDLTSDIYASLISREHAILNFTGKHWYFEDVGSSNGSGMKRKSEEKKFKVEEGKSYKVGSGDILYIANTKLLVK